MSRQKIAPYPMVSVTDVREKLGASVLFFYTSDGKQVEVEVVKSGHFRIMSPAWRPRLDPLTVTAKISIERPHLLFSGSDDESSCRVVSNGSQVGIAMKWLLPETKVRGVEMSKVRLTSTTKGRIDLVITHTFPSSYVRTRAEFYVELFLVGASKGKEDVFARIVGSELAFLGCNVLHCGGSGGMFPATSADLGKGAPLWELKLHIDDELDLQRDFSGDVCMLCLNSGHRQYQEVVRSDLTGAISPLMFEIFSECCVMLLVRGIKVVDECGSVDVLEQRIEDEGDGMSTLSVLKYMKRTLLPEVPMVELVDANLEELSRMMRISLGRRLKVIASDIAGEGVC